MTAQNSSTETNSTPLLRDEANGAPPHISVCICTFRRPELLARLLAGLLKLQGNHELFTFSCVVIDNDEKGSAAEVVSSFQNSGGLEIIYQCEPERNFAVVRNRVVRQAKGQYVAFIDGDEVPVDCWLSELYRAMLHFEADGVLGPVRPYFDSSPPAWITKGRLCERPAHPTGMELDWRQTRTGNVLLKKSIFDISNILFDPAFRTGGEDVDFFRRAMKKGRRFVWCEEAAAYELVPPERCCKSYFLKRALLQGRISLKYAAEKPSLCTWLQVGTKSTIAIFGYTLMLPFLFLSGYGTLMKYLIKDCHHLGRLLALLRVPILEERNL